VEAARTRLELCSLDSQEVEGFEVDDVEAAVAIRQYLGGSRVDDDRVDDVWVDTRSG